MYPHPSWDFFLNEDNPIKGSVSDIIAGCLDHENEIFYEERPLFVQNLQIAKHKTRMIPS